MNTKPFSLVIYQCIYLSFVAPERVSIENTNTDIGITDYLTENLHPYINSLDAFWQKCQTTCEKPPLPIPRALRTPNQVSDDFTLEISQLRRSWSQEATLLFRPSELILVLHDYYPLTVLPRPGVQPTPAILAMSMVKINHDKSAVCFVNELYSSRPSQLDRRTD